MLFTGIALDELAERKLLPEPLQAIMEADESFYGVDETLALGITNVYGMIGLTSFGYLDKVKPGIIRKLNEKGQACPCLSGRPGCGSCRCRIRANCASGPESQPVRDRDSIA